VSAKPGVTNAKPTSAASMSAASAPASGTSVVILAAGLGKRMKSARPKVLHPVCGRPLLAWVVDQALSLSPSRILVVVGHGQEEVERALQSSGQLARVTLVRQEPQLGTGHALQCCIPALGKDPGRVVVLYGDMPLLEAESLTELVSAHAEGAADGVALLTAFPDDSRGFGRIVRSEDGIGVRAIVEEKDATLAERAIGEVNLGVYAFHGEALLNALPKLQNKNKQGEFYLTDVIGMFVKENRPAVAVELENPAEAIGVNTLADLAEARWALQVRILEEHLANGVYIEDPSTTYIDHGVEIGAGSTILPCTVIRAGVKVGAGCEVGPFTHLRAGTVLEDGAEVGNFTEAKNAKLGAKSKAKHLAYLGDVTIGSRTNIGAGTIFANYDGKKKHPTVVGDNAFVGSGTVVVAPNTIGSGATTGAGAVVTRDSGVGDGQVWVGVPARRLTKSSKEHAAPADPAHAPKSSSKKAH
jgi:bifunctional UDP-N-acetylglucosamine pyrophosphorylase/glucosamine-1-phosphate N-acetyltransferase